MRNYILLGLLLFVWFGAFTQNTRAIEGPYSTFYQAEDLYNKSQFAAARIAFESFIQQSKPENNPVLIQAEYYRGLSALKLYHNDAVQLLKDFLVKQPESNHRNAIYQKIAAYYFQEEDYEKALEYFDISEPQGLDSLEHISYYFKKGYAAFQLNQFDKSLISFREIKDSPGQYGSPALYYFSYINYYKSYYQVAQEGFIKLKKDPTFSSIVPYYIVQIYHKQGLYDSVVNYGSTLIDSTGLSNKNDILKLLGNAHYQLENYKEAVPFLLAHNKDSKTDRTDDYQLGFAYFQSGQYEKSISFLDKAARIDDSLGHTALYQVGSAYSALGKPVPARSAYERAAKMKSLPILAEDALFQFAVISFKIDINPYDESVRAFETYLNTYPNSPKKADIYQYLVNVYTSTNNYSKAIESLDKIQNKDAELKNVYQIVAYNYGVELLQKNDLNKSLEAFGWVDKYTGESKIMALAKYWRGEVYIRKGEPQKAMDEYKKFLAYDQIEGLNEKKDAYYQLGYAYLSLDQTADALQSFGIYIQSNPKDADKKTDAYFQLADGNYALGKDEVAINYYKQIIKQGGSLNDRATYYLAKAYGYNKQAALKITTLETLLSNYPNSQYIQIGLFDLAMSYKSQSKFEEAFEQFELFIEKYPRSSKVINARIEIADIYYKQWKYTESETAYRGILTEYGNKQDICAVAAKGLMDVYIAMKTPEKAESVANEFSCVNLSMDEKENLYYNPALQSYIDTNYREAKTKFESYLEKFPNGRFSQDAHYFLGSCCLKTKDTLAAVKEYEAYLSGNTGSYFEPVAYRLASYFYDIKDYVQAIKYYGKLESLAVKSANIFASKTGLMRSYFLTEDFPNSKSYGSLVLATTGLSPAVKIEAEYVLGVSNFNLEKWTEAQSSFEWLTANTSSVKAAEARYCLAFIADKLNDQENALQIIKALIKMKPSYTYWVAKGLILQSRIHISKLQYVEAEQTMSDVIDYYPKNEDDGILIEAQQLLNEIKQLQNPIKTTSEEPQNVIEIKPNN